MQSKSSEKFCGQIGKLKSVECRQFLERLDANGVICLPLCRKQFAKKTIAKVPRTERTDSQATISTKLRELSPISGTKTALV
ncbi:MAG: hypothetical protein JRF31_13415 [Deltaproteobacteria bacterium]|nr:hypothetical protein [Deltaproteobacteria bacterium]